ncbi:MAG TPA: hypothetical protein DCY38_01925 [Opitutae bacterium]|nr:hypothetical protein [Opitutae bacterium]
MAGSASALVFKHGAVPWVVVLVFHIPAVSDFFEMFSAYFKNIPSSALAPFQKCALASYSPGRMLPCQSQLL